MGPRLGKSGSDRLVFHLDARACRRYRFLCRDPNRGGHETPMVSRRVVRSYEARYGLGANKASMNDLSDAIDVHAHARGHDEEEPLHAAREASRAGMKAILFKSISPGRPWEVARKVQEDV